MLFSIIVPLKTTESLIVNGSLINTLSPIGLVSPRYFENMGSKCLVFCEESENYKNIFQDNTYVTFKNDLSDFDEKFYYYLSETRKRNEIVNRAYLHIHEKHTWKKRINQLMQYS